MISGPEVNRETLVRAVQFGAVGATGTVLNVGVFALLTTVGVPLLAAGAVAWLAANVTNYALNWRVTFDAPDGHLLERYPRYLATSAVGFVVYLLVLNIVVPGLEAAGVPPAVGAVVAIVAGAGANFLGANELVFPEATR